MDNEHLQHDFEQVRDITVIGAGPVGMITAFWAGMRQATARIVDSLPNIGGQLTTLYPEKWVFDIPGHPKILARDLADHLHEQSIEQFDVPVHLETTAESFSYEPDPADPERQIIRLKTDRGDLLSHTIVIAGGHGAFEPKKLPNFDLDAWENKGLHYFVIDKSVFKGQRVLIIGGGDSACDWALNLLDTAADITLVHRRDEFRAHEGTAKEIVEAKTAGKIRVLTPFQLRDVSGDGKIERVTVAGGPDGDIEETFECDAVLLQLGFKTALGPLAEWGFEVEKGAIVVDNVFKTNQEGIWAAGDITTFVGKLKLIATGFGEAAIAVAQAVHYIRPETKIQPKYSTNTGVPDAAAAEESVAASS